MNDRPPDEVSDPDDDMSSHEFFARLALSEELATKDAKIKRFQTALERIRLGDPDDDGSWVRVSGPRAEYIAEVALRADDD